MLLGAVVGLGVGVVLGVRVSVIVAVFVGVVVGVGMITGVWVALLVGVLVAVPVGVGRDALYVEVGAYWLRREIAAQCERAGEGITLSEEANSFPLFLGAHRAYRAAARVAGGETAAIADMFAALAMLAETGNQAGAPGTFVAIADMYITAEQLVEARGAVETGLAVAAQTGQGCFDAELHRLQGEIVLKAVDNSQSTVDSEKTAEEYFCRALDIARLQEAKCFHLRAATSIAHLWRDQGKRTEARDLLAPLYAWFTEGFDTRDLKDAKALLEEL